MIEDVIMSPLRKVNKMIMLHQATKKHKWSIISGLDLLNLCDFEPSWLEKAFRSGLNNELIKFDRVNLVDEEKRRAEIK